MYQLSNYIDMNYCFECGESVPQGANFCPGCGTDLSVMWEDDGSDDTETAEAINMETTSEQDSEPETDAPSDEEPSAASKRRNDANQTDEPVGESSQETTAQADDAPQTDASPVDQERSNEDVPDQASPADAQTTVDSATEGAHREETGPDEDDSASGEEPVSGGLADESEETETEPEDPHAPMYSGSAGSARRRDPYGTTSSQTTTEGDTSDKIDDSGTDDGGAESDESDSDMPSTSASSQDAGADDPGTGDSEGTETASSTGQDQSSAGTDGDGKNATQQATPDDTQTAENESSARPSYSRTESPSEPSQSVDGPSDQAAPDSAVAQGSSGSLLGNAVIGVVAFAVSYVGVYLAMIVDVLVLSDTGAEVSDLMPTEGFLFAATEQGPDVLLQVWELVVWLLVGALNGEMEIIDDAGVPIADEVGPIAPLDSLGGVFTVELYYVVVGVVLLIAGYVAGRSAIQPGRPVSATQTAKSGVFVALGYAAMAAVLASVFTVTSGELVFAPVLQTTVAFAAGICAVVAGAGGYLAGRGASSTGRDGTGPTSASDANA